MAKLIDPTRAELIRELRLFRRGEGEPSAERLTGMFHLVEALGEGVPQRAFDELAGLRLRHGSDPRSAIGAYFYLSGWGVGMATVNQRRNRYVEDYPCDISTAWRRSERGIDELATLIRDVDEHARPWAFVSLFQSGAAFQPVLDFNLGVESWRAPTVLLNGIEQASEFVVHPAPGKQDWFTHRMVLPETELDLTAAFGEQMGALRVIWAMPVWPVWNVVSWTADPRILTRLRTFRQRAVEVSLEWWKREPADRSAGLVTDGRVWTDQTALGQMNLPDGWSI